MIPPRPFPSRHRESSVPGRIRSFSGWTPERSRGGRHRCRAESGRVTQGGCPPRAVGRGRPGGRSGRSGSARVGRSRPRPLGVRVASRSFRRLTASTVRSPDPTRPVADVATGRVGPAPRIGLGPGARRIRLERRPVGVGSGNRGRIVPLRPVGVAVGPARPEPPIAVELIDGYRRGEPWWWMSRPNHLRSGKGHVAGTVFTPAAK